MVEPRGPLLYYNISVKHPGLFQDFRKPVSHNHWAVIESLTVLISPAVRVLAISDWVLWESRSQGLGPQRSVLCHILIGNLSSDSVLGYAVATYVLLVVLVLVTLLLGAVIVHYRRKNLNNEKALHTRSAAWYTSHTLWGVRWENMSSYFLAGNKY